MIKYVLSTSVILLAVLAVSSCGKRPSYVLSTDKMTEVLYDVQLAKAIFEETNHGFDTPESKERLMRGIYEKHNITEAALDSSVMWYSDNLKLYNEINDSVLSRLSQKQALLREEELAFNGQTDTENGILPQHFYLDRKKSNYAFTLDSVALKAMDSISFQLEFDVQGLNPTHRVELGMYYTYKDTSIQNTTQIDNNRHYSIDKPNRPDSLLKQIRGYIRLRENRKNQIPVLIYNVQSQDSISLSNSTLKMASEVRLD